MVLGPVQAFTGPDTKLQWTDLYASDSLNKAFLGMPNGIYLGFTPVISGQTLTLKTDTAVTFSSLTGSFTIGDTLTGSTSGATAVIRLVSAGIPDRGFILVDGITGNFQIGETITAPGASAEIDNFTSDGVSLAKLNTTSQFAGNRTEEQLTVLITSEIELDFSPISVTDGTYYVNLTADYEIGVETTAQIISIKDTPPDGRFIIGICSVTKFGTSLTLEPVTIYNRSDPYADIRTRNGFMPADSILDLSQALTTTAEVVATHFCYNGVDHGTFNAALPRTTGLPGRLNSDLERNNMAARMGKELLSIQGNDYPITSFPTGNTINVSGSFSAKTRTSQPYRDITNGLIPAGLVVPVYLRPDGYRGVTLTVTGATGGFTPGTALVGLTGGGTAIIQSSDGTTIDLDDIGNSFFVGETVNNDGVTATVSAVDIREGAVTASEDGLVGDPERNIVLLLNTSTGKRPVNADGNSIYGRLLFGPSGSAGPGGGDPGELLVAENAGEQINYTNGSTVITGNNIDFTEYFLPGDLIEGDDNRFYEIDSGSGAVQAGTIFLSTGKPYVGPNASAGFGVGSGPRRRLRYLLKFVSRSGGVEVDETITADSVPTGSALRIFFPAWLTRAQSNYHASLSMQAPGVSHKVPGQGSTVPGVAYDASIGPSTPIVGAIKSVQVAGVDPGAGNYHTINYALTGTAPTPTLTQTAPGVISINAVGPVGPPGGTGASPPGPPGPQGKGFDNIFASLAVKTIPITGASGSDSFDFSPRRVRFYTISAAIGAAQGGLHTGYITSVDTPDFDVDSTITFDYQTSGFASTLVVYCAAATN